MTYPSSVNSRRTICSNLSVNADLRIGCDDDPPLWLLAEIILDSLRFGKDGNSLLSILTSFIQYCNSFKD